MSRFKNEVQRLQAHVKTLRCMGIGLFCLALAMGVGWWQAPRFLTIHVPPDLRSGSTRKWWDVPPESVYTFALYVFQQLNRWPVDGENDYARNIQALTSYLTPSCVAYLSNDFTQRRSAGELRKRVRGIYEIPGRGYSDDPTMRVQSLSRNDWLVTLDVSADEYYGSEQVKRALVRYPIKVVRADVNPEKNPFGLMLDCFSSTPQRIVLPEASATASSSRGHLPNGDEKRQSEEKHP